MLSIPARIAAYTLLAAIGAGVLSYRLHDPGLSFAQIGNLVLWASFCVGALLLDNAIKKAKDDAYLYYLGVSGLRMLLYMAALGLAVFSSPGLRDRAMILLLTVGFLSYTVVEVTSFVRKLREIFKSNP